MAACTLHFHERLGACRGEQWGTTQTALQQVAAAACTLHNRTMQRRGAYTTRERKAGHVQAI